MRNALLLSCVIASLWSAAARAQHQRFAPAYVDPDPERAAREWVDAMRSHLAPGERAACPGGADAQAEQACILGVVERRGDAAPPPGDAPPQAAPEPSPWPGVPESELLLHAVPIC